MKNTWLHYLLVVSYVISSDQPMAILLKKMTIFVIFFEKKIKFLAIF